MIMKHHDEYQIIPQDLVASTIEVIAAVIII